MKLFIVATPIGNLSDITFRALETLKSVDVIVAEDTRVTHKLLARYEIQKQLVSFHEHSQRKDIEKIHHILRSGKTIAYVVDAGTPGISDPGNFLIRETVRVLPECLIVPIPGASALTAALSVAGLESNEFLFLGFPPHKKGRVTFFKKLADIPYPIVLYESPHRIQKTLDDLCLHGLSMFNGVLLKEISKVYETILRDSILGLKETLGKEKKIKGEFVLIINKKIK